MRSRCGSGRRPVPRARRLYSLAITIREPIDARGANLDVQIFGTDIDDRAIEFAQRGPLSAHHGHFPRAPAALVLSKTEGAFCPTRQIREMCVFSVHNVTKDPPFSKLDLISCRNLMIYMDGDLQDRVLRTFHYALKPDGLLFLGSSEGVSAQRQAVHDPGQGRSHLPAARRRRGVSLPCRCKSQAPRHANRVLRANLVAAPATASIAASARLWQILARVPGGRSPQQHCALLGRGSRPYLEPSAGAASLSLQSNLRKSLRIVVRTALQSVVKTGEGWSVEMCLSSSRAQKRSAERHRRAGAGRGRRRTVRRRVPGRPHHRPRAATAADGRPKARKPWPPSRSFAPRERSCRRRSSDLETANEEMKSAAEEYQSVNEELQSTNEELQTSKEEMQSINEELQTVNAEMLAKNDLLSNLNSDLQNLLDSTQIATIFLDDNLRIKNFTPGMSDIFSLREGDRGRPLTEIVSLIAYDDLQRDVAKVLRELTVFERELDLRDRNASSRCASGPIAVSSDVIDGVVHHLCRRDRAQAGRAGAGCHRAPLHRHRQPGRGRHHRDRHFGGGS